MKKLLFILLSISFTLNAQNNFFELNSDHQPDLVNFQKKDTPVKEQYYNLDLNSLKDFLSNNRNNNNFESVILNLPGADGKFKDYAIFEESLMETSLQLKYPNIKSYKVVESITHRNC
jgi:hypothetical protein